MATDSKQAAEAVSAPDRPARTPAEIEADIEATRLRLQGTVDAIADRVKPANVARRGVEAAKAQVVETDGSLRTTRVAALAAAAAVVGLVFWRRRR
jgi:MYXO-CTERM domain-containing protein